MTPPAPLATAAAPPGDFFMAVRSSIPRSWATSKAAVHWSHNPSIASILSSMSWLNFSRVTLPFNFT